MNVAELERLVAALEEQVYWTAHTDLHVTTISLASRVIAAEKLVGTLSYLQTQAENGTLHPQVVIQNARESITAYEATK